MTDKNKKALKTPDSEIQKIYQMVELHQAEY